MTHEFLLLLMLCAVFYPVDVLAGVWGGKRDQHNESRFTQPFVQDGASRTLGIYAGVIPASDGVGRFKSAYLVVSPGGYIIPIHSDGIVAVAGHTFFKSTNCNGPGYVRTSSGQPVFTAMPGTVYREMSEDRLVYVPFDSPQLTTSMYSYLDPGNKHACINEAVTGSFYKLENNNAAITGYENTVFREPLSLYYAGPVDRKMQVSHPKKAFTSSTAVSADIIDIQEECSPGCLSEDNNNGICDIACWTAACDYDSSDCDHLSQSELEEKLSSICSPGCFAEDIGDGFCDGFCNVELCNYDGGDCVEK